MSPTKEIPLEQEICYGPFNLIPIPEGDDNSVNHKGACHMVIVHNMYLRLLNSIYLQADGVEKNGSETDVKAFMWYTGLFCRLIENHHDAEEEVYFPAVQEAANDPKLFEQSIDQHKMFLDGLANLKKYATDCQSGEKEYSASTLKQLIDAFGNDLRKHLYDEIDELEKLPLNNEDSRRCAKLLSNESRSKSVMSEDLVVMVCLGRPGPGAEHHRIPLPGFLKYVAAYGVWFKHSDAWKFLPCDYHGQPLSKLAF